MNTGSNAWWWLHIISVIVHCIIIVSIVVAVCVLASDKQLTPDALGLLGTLGGGTVVSLGINGRKVPQSQSDNASSQT